MNQKIDKNEFYYYLHGTDDESAETLEDIFNHGLKDEYGTSLGSTMEKIEPEDIERFGLSHKMKASASGSHKSVFLIKIPKKYMGDILHRDGTIDCPIPLLKSTGQKTYEGRGIYYFTNHLVQGVYNRTTDSFITNPNFCPVFNPNGFVYSDEQINNFWSLNQIQWVKYAKSRKQFSYEKLYEIDTKRKTFDEYMKSYSNYFKATPLINTEFDVSAYKRDLQSKRELGDMFYSDRPNIGTKHNK